MASKKGGIVNEAPGARAPKSPNPAVATGSFGADVGGAAKLSTASSSPSSLKRPRDTTSTSPVSGSGSDLSPAKVARLVGFSRHVSPPAPLMTGAAELPDERRRRREADQTILAEALTEAAGRNDKSGLMLEDLFMKTEKASRPDDAPPQAELPLPLPPIETSNRADNPVPTSEPTGPPDPGAPSAYIGAADGLEEALRLEVEHSPAPMDVDSRPDQRVYTPQLHAQIEEKASTSSLSYPGVLPPGSLMQAAAPQRGMSLPTANTQGGDLSAASGTKKHKCPFCNTEFTRQHNLKSHLLTHSHEKPYVCATCDMRFRRLHDLKRHSKLHTGEKPHICQKCARKFARGDALARHAKGAGGCAGRRPSFVGDEDYEGPSMVDHDDSTMAGVLCGAAGDADMTEDDRRRLTMPTMRNHQVPGKSGGEHVVTHSDTHAEATRVTGGRLDQGVGTGHDGGLHSNHGGRTRAVPDPNASIFSQSGMTESPKRLSPGRSGTGAQHQNALGSHAMHSCQVNDTARGLCLPSPGMFEAGHIAWLSHYPSADGQDMEDSAAAAAPDSNNNSRSKNSSSSTNGSSNNGRSNNGSRNNGSRNNGSHNYHTNNHTSNNTHFHNGVSSSPTDLARHNIHATAIGGETQSGQALTPAQKTQGQGQGQAPAVPIAKNRGEEQALGRNGMGDLENASNLFASGEPGVWAYLQHLDDKIKHLSIEVEARKRNEAVLMDRLLASERRQATIANELAVLRQQRKEAQISSVPGASSR